MTRWMHPPELDRQRERDRFDPEIEGSRYSVSRELSLAIWERVCADATDSTGRRDMEQARERFHELAARIAARGDRLRPDIGRLTRVGVEINGDSLGPWSISELRPHTPGRETLITAAARRLSKHDGDRVITPELVPGGVVKPSAPGRRTLVGHAESPRLGFADYRVRGLKEVLRLLGPNHPLRQDLIAAAATTDRSIAGRATLWCEPLPNTTTPNGHALWYAAERHAVTLYRRAMGSDVVNQDDPAVEAALQQRGSGQLLPMELRHAMESELCVSLTGVRLHTDAVAGQAARALSAEAFTVGEDIFFADGAFTPDTRSGRKLLVHELTHVVQALHGATASTVEGLRVSQPGESLEQEADAVAERLDRAAASSAPGGPAVRSPARTIPPSAWNDAQQSGRSATMDESRARTIYRKTKGEEVVDNAHTNFLDPDASVKADVDVMKAGLKEVKANKSVAFNRDAIKKKIESALKTLGQSSVLKTVEAEWEALVNDRAKAGTPDYVEKEKAFFNHFRTPLADLTAKYPKSQTKYWLKNTPSKVVDEIVAASDTDMSADQLYTYAMKEGLVDYVRSEAGVTKTDDPTASQLAGVSTTQSISGFNYLGTDDFFTELTTANEPLTKYLPAGFDTKKVTIDPHTNEHGRTVQSAIFPNLKMGLQALSATMKRRRALFLVDVTKHGYANPTTDESVYWTYVYYNAGEFNGQLKKYKGKRVLNDWIKAGEFSNAIKVLQSWQMIKEMKIF